MHLKGVDSALHRSIVRRCIFFRVVCSHSQLQKYLHMFIAKEQYVSSGLLNSVWKEVGNSAHFYIHMLTEVTGMWRHHLFGEHRVWGICIELFLLVLQKQWDARRAEKLRRQKSKRHILNHHFKQSEWGDQSRPCIALSSSAKLTARQNVRVTRLPWENTSSLSVCSFVACGVVGNLFILLLFSQGLLLQLIFSFVTETLSWKHEGVCGS